MDHNRFSHSHVHLSGVSIGHNVYRKGFLDGDTARMPRRHWWVGVSTMRWFYQRRQSQKATADIERKWYVMWIDVVWPMVQLKWHMTYGSKSWHMMTYDDINQMTYDINVISGLLWRVWVTSRELTVTLPVARQLPLRGRSNVSKAQWWSRLSDRGPFEKRQSVLENYRGMIHDTTLC